MEDRCKTMKGRPTKFDKVVRREICQMTSRGTRMAAAGSSEDMTYLTAISGKSSYSVRSEQRDYIFVSYTLQKLRCIHHHKGKCEKVLCSLHPQLRVLCLTQLDLRGRVDSSLVCCSLGWQFLLINLSHLDHLGRLTGVT